MEKLKLTNEELINEITRLQKLIESRERHYETIIRVLKNELFEKEDTILDLQWQLKDREEEIESLTEENERLSHNLT